MYRSSGELRKYARCVFALYCVDEALSIARFRLAWYVLWGKWPDERVVRLLFKETEASADGSERTRGEETVTGESVTPKAVEHDCHLVGDSLAPSASSSALPRRIYEEEFIRFAVTYHDTMGADAVEFGGAEDTDEAVVDVQRPPSSVVRGRQWVQFQSLAGSKGYVTLDDLVATEGAEWLHRPMSGGSKGGAPAKRAGPDALAPPQGDGEGRLAVMSHVFAIIDRDRDGKVVFDDVVRHLGTTA
ncbi:uncharacterized protein Tco025E_05077 [Trypanosoma conorhini]|uniref:EF-hand domain-containing protein n=1 Tax=Trypanosoma conorhini TaxID=83891 RepID=A0A3R7P4B8_9TRYP|nr:uncharacterized protein Tco025E_05077 [Trypanosoma conorhini]RNF17148.1 hypothetical protein Tco025E_05077 [Trypanosoma conorhini]